MSEVQVNTCNSNPVILGIEVWSSKGVQKVLNQIGRIDFGDFERVNTELRNILQYPGMWDVGNISRFLDIFNPFVKRHFKNDEKRLTLIGTWKKFEELKAEQEIAGVTISVEDKVNDRLSGNGKGGYYHGDAYGLGGTGAYSIRR